MVTKDALPIIAALSYLFFTASPSCVLDVMIIERLGKSTGKPPYLGNLKNPWFPVVPVNP
jgi:hypothetical protein